MTGQRVPEPSRIVLLALLLQAALHSAATTTTITAPSNPAHPYKYQPSGGSSSSRTTNEHSRTDGEYGSVAPVARAKRERSYWSQLQGSWGKRDDELRGWNAFRGSWGKKADWSSLRGAWGKRSLREVSPRTAETEHVLLSNGDLDAQRPVSSLSLDDEELLLHELARAPGEEPTLRDLAAALAEGEAETISVAPETVSSDGIDGHDEDWQDELESTTQEYVTDEVDKRSGDLDWYSALSNSHLLFPRTVKWSSLRGSWGKRGGSNSWSQLRGTWGKKADTQRWSSLNDSLRKRAQNNWSSLRNSWGKRELGKSWSSLRGSWGKRDPQNSWSSFRGSWGKRQPDNSWNSFRGSWGKREDTETNWRNFRGSWGKREPEKLWKNFRGSWGKRDSDDENSELESVQDK